MNIDSIQNGIVLDHITAGKGMEIYHNLGLEKLDCSVAIITNVKSSKMGKKDIIKIDKEYSINLDLIGYIDPNVSVSTKEIYQRVDKYKMFNKVDNIKLVESLETGNSSVAFSNMKNVMQDVTSEICPEIANIIEKLESLGAEVALMSGSGATCYGVFADENVAKVAQKQLSGSITAFEGGTVIMINKAELENAIREYFHDLIRKGVHSCDVVDTNAYIQRIIEELDANPWNPVWCSVPPDDGYVLLSFANFSIPIVGRYETDKDGVGAFYAGDEDETLASQDMIVNAWMELPNCYKDE